MISVASVGCDVELDGDILAYVGFRPIRRDSSRNDGDLNSLSEKGQQDYEYKGCVQKEPV